MENAIEKLNKLVLFFIIYSIVFVVFFSTIGYTLPFVLAIIFAMILKNPTRFLIKKFRMSPTVSTLLTTIIFFTVIIVVVLLSITSVTSELFQLTVKLSAYIQSKSPELYPIVDNVRNYFDNLDPSILDKVKTSLSSSADKLATRATDIGTYVITLSVSIISSVPYLMMVIVFTLIATYFFTKDLTKPSNDFLKTLFNKESERIIYIFNEAKRMLLTYLRSYMIVILITFAVTLFGFLFLRVRYALVLSVLCAIFDVLPVLGIATVYIPLAIIYFAGHLPFTGAGLIVLYALVAIIRQIAEPRIVSSSLGLHPVAVIAAIFIGLKANGLAGMFFCIFLVVFYNILKKVEVL